MAYDYDLAVVGAGQGGLPAAHMAANVPRAIFSDPTLAAVGLTEATS